MKEKWVKKIHWLVYSDCKSKTVTQLINMSLVQTVDFNDDKQIITFYYTGGSTHIDMLDKTTYLENKEKVINF